MKQISEDVSCH